MSNVVDVRCQIVVGREAELALLGEALAAALAGSGRAVFLTGEPGIGKSRLAREIADQARSRGAVAAVGRAVPAGASTPYRPLTEALLQALRGRLLPTGRDLAPWLPALAAIVPTPGGDRRTEPGTLTAAIRGEAVIRLLGALAEPAGLVIVLEDLHWADPDTLAVTEYLADNLAAQRVLCLATSRSEPPSAALDLIRRLHDRRAVAQLALERLPPGQVAAMIRSCVPSASDDVVAWVQHAADGVPFLVEEVLASPGVPASFRDAVRARLAEIGADERGVLEAAAVLGRHFDWRLLGAITGQPVDVVSRALERGVSQLLLAVDGQEFRFRHALTRDAVAGTLLPPRQAALAGAALAAVESAHPGLAGPWRDTAASLAAQSGDRARAGLLLAGSGRASLAAGALATAVDTLRQAATLLAGDDRAGDGRDAGRPAGDGLTGDGLTGTEAGLVEALALAGRVDEATAVGTRLIERLGEQDATARARAEVHLRLAHACAAATRWPAAASHLAAASGLLADSPDAGLSGQAAVLAAEVAMAGDDLVRARGLAAGALEGDGTAPQVRCQAWELIGRSLRLPNLDAAEEAFEHALAEADRAGLPFWRLRALHELGTIEMFRGTPPRRLEQARQMADELGAMSIAAVLDLQLAAAADARFDLDGLTRHAESSLAISERLGLDAVKAKALHFLVESRALGGDRDGCERYIALARTAAPGDPVIEAFAWGGGRGMLALLSGDQAGAVRAFERSAALLRDCQHPEPANFRGVWLLVLAATGDERAPAELGAAAAEGITEIFGIRGFARCAEAILAGRAGDPGRAQELSAAAEQALAPYPVWADIARMYLAEAAGADDWGDPGPWLRTALGSFTRHGITALADRCAAALGEPAPGRWARLGVTAREADVLRLVAEGLPNREIAARLYLSPRTVEKHVESLLRKTGARSRTQLVAIAGPGDPAPGPAS
jgi:DNA-binding CsgD family transcriptional regulator/tetratricopeptide (TPR) repeat protein